MDRPIGYSVAEAQRQLGGCSRAHIYRLVNAGKLKLAKVGGRSLITSRSIEELVEAPSARAAA